MSGFGDVTIRDGNGTAKEVISAKSLAGRVWDDVEKRFDGFSKKARLRPMGKNNGKFRKLRIAKIMGDK